MKSEMDWNDSYVIPADLCFRLTPSGGLQVDGGAGEPSVEVPRDWVPLLLAFAWAGTGKAVYEAVTEDWEVDRETFPMYSGLAPHTHIAPHYGYSNAKLRCQLPLQVPGRCRLKVGEHEVEQREGKCIVFDDSFLHSAWNDSDEPRFVLVFDFFHPDLTPEEVQYLARLASDRELAKGHLGQESAKERVDWASPVLIQEGAAHGG